MSLKIRHLPDTTASVIFGAAACSIAVLSNHSHSHSGFFIRVCCSRKSVQKVGLFFVRIWIFLSCAIAAQEWNANFLLKHKKDCHSAIRDHSPLPLFHFNIITIIIIR